MYLILQSWCTKGSPYYFEWFFGNRFCCLDKRYSKEYGNLTIITRCISEVSQALNLPYYHTLFYVTAEAGKGLVKVVPTCIAQLLTPIALAIWIQDDGTFDHGAIYLQTQGFSKEGVELLIS